MDDKQRLILVKRADAHAMPLAAMEPHPSKTGARDVAAASAADASPNADPLKCLREFFAAHSDIADTADPGGKARQRNSVKVK